MLPAHLSHPFSPAGRLDPHPAYDWFRENDPVHFEKFSRWWLAVSHAGCAEGLGSADFSAALGQQERARDDDLPASMLTSDPPAHARLRGPGALLLGPAALRSQAGSLQGAIDRVLGGLAGRAEADAAADIGEPYAVEVFTGLLSIPAGLKAPFTELARRVSVNLDPMGGDGAAGRAAAAEFSAFMGRHVQALTAAGTDCPLTRLAADPRLSRDEMLGIVTLSVVGGFLPLADLPGHAAYWLGQEGFAALPGQLPASPLAGRDGQAAGGVIDELMRLAPPIPFTARVTRAATELQGVRLPAGARVLFVIAAANRDPAVFARPGEFDSRRSPNPHLAFGGGPHLCLGAPLVRWAGGAMLRELAVRFPGLHQQGQPEWDKPLVPRRFVSQRLHLRA